MSSESVKYWQDLMTRASSNEKLLQRLQVLTTPKQSKYCPIIPSPKQSIFLLLNCREALYGGAAGGGKSFALLAAALQYVDDEPDYAALILRRTLKQLSMPDAILDIAKQWLAPFTKTKEVRWNDDMKEFKFPSGATLTFGYLESETDLQNYTGPAFQYIGFDELTQFPQRQYTFLFSRLRRKETMKATVPLRVRAGTNPGGYGHEWVKQRFLVEGKKKGRVFIPAKLQDNPHLDIESYIESLGETDPITLKRLLEGDWDAAYSGTVFVPAWFGDPVDVPRDLRKVRHWDLAGTKPEENHPDPDWTCGALLGFDDRDQKTYILDIVRMRDRAGEVEKFVRKTAEQDGRGVPIRMEQEPASSGKSVIDRYQRQVLQGWDFRGVRATGDKETRAKPFASQASAGNVKLARGVWIGDFLTEAAAFPEGAHDDQIDAVVGAYEDLVIGSRNSARRIPARHLWPSRKQIDRHRRSNW